MKMCPACLPGALTPSWQLAQPVVMPAWVNVAGDQASVLWQVPHSWVVGMCVDPLPAAFVPSWHDEQVPRTWAWFTPVAGLQVATE